MSRSISSILPGMISSSPIRLNPPGLKVISGYFRRRVNRYPNTTLEYDYNKKITDFKEELSLSPGSYLLVTGNRLANSRILSELTFFELAEGEHKSIEVKIRKDPSAPKILGNIDLSTIFKLLNQNVADQSRITEKGLAIIWIDPDKEPSKHIFNDLPHLKKELDDWGGYFIFLTDTSVKWDGFSNESLKSLPSNLLCAHDTLVLNDKLKTLDPTGIRLPFVIMTDKNGNILYCSSGYRIGIGEQILRFAR
jgi:hypothetical protein